jgi:hypothetical protein
VPELDINDAPCNQNGTCTGQYALPAGCTNFPCPPAGSFCELGGNDCGPQAADAGMVCDTGTEACNQSAVAGEPTVSGSSCTPSATMAMLTPVQWATVGEACGGATPGTGCANASDTCLPTLPGAFETGVCVMQAGAATSCPALFPNLHTFYSGTTEGRGCTACSCGSASGESCAVTFTLYSNSVSCAGALAGTVVSGQCIALTGSVGIVSIEAAVTAAPTGGMCTAIDGQPTGTATPSGATTFCCQ